MWYKRARLKQREITTPHTQPYKLINTHILTNTISCIHTPPNTLYIHLTHITGKLYILYLEHIKEHHRLNARERQLLEEMQL